MTSRTTSVAWIAIATLALAPAFAPTPAEPQAPTVIRLATFVPDGSVWHRAMREMGAEWAASTGGRVQLKVYPGGVAGDEPDYVRKMRIGQIQAAAITTAGLAQIDNAFQMFGVPMFFESYPELYAVLDKMTPILKQRLEAKGFKRLAWGSAGWVQIFSKKPIATLADVKAAKMFTTQGDDRMVQWYKQNGFRPVALNQGDIPAQLKLSTGMIDAAPMPPYPALLLNIFRDATYMLDVNVAPLYGGLVLSMQTWNKLSAADKAILEETSKNIEKRLLGEAAKQDASSIATMKLRPWPVPSRSAIVITSSRCGRWIGGGSGHSN